MKDAMKYTLPKEHLSPSQVGALDRCAAQYEWIYVKGMKRPPEWSLIHKQEFHHTVLEGDFLSRIRGEGPWSQSRLLEFHQANLETRLHEVRECRDTEGVDAEKLIAYEIDEAKAIFAEKDFDAWRLSTEPVQVEEELRIETDEGIPVVARLDVQGYSPDEVLRVTDLKRTGSAYPESLAPKTLQLRTYAWASGIPEVGHANVVEKKKPQFKFSAGRVSEADIAATKLQYLDAAERITRGVFPPIQIGPMNEWVCSAKFCGFWPADATDWKTGAPCGCPYGQKARVQVAV